MILLTVRLQEVILFRVRLGAVTPYGRLKCSVGVEKSPPGPLFGVRLREVSFSGGPTALFLLSPVLHPTTVSVTLPSFR